MLKVYFSATAFPNVKYTAVIISLTNELDTNLKLPVNDKN